MARQQNPAETQEQTVEIPVEQQQQTEHLPDQLHMSFGFLRERTGKTSGTRVMSLLALLASIWFGWMTLAKNVPSENGVYITTAFLLAAFAPKVLQKFVEDVYHSKGKRD